MFFVYKKKHVLNYDDKLVPRICYESQIFKIILMKVIFGNYNKCAFIVNVLFLNFWNKTKLICLVSRGDVYSLFPKEYVQWICHLVSAKSTTIFLYMYTHIGKISDNTLTFLSNFYTSSYFINDLVFPCTKNVC